MLRRYDYAMNLLLPHLILWGWKCQIDRDPVEGDIVVLQSAPASEWHISIYRGRSEGGHYDCQHLLESLKTGMHLQRDELSGFGQDVRFDGKE